MARPLSTSKLPPEPCGGILDQGIDSGPSPQLARGIPTISFLALAPQIGARDALETLRPAEIENTEPKNLTAARDGVMLDGARDDLLART